MELKEKGLLKHFAIHDANEVVGIDLSKMINDGLVIIDHAARDLATIVNRL